jgi:hypothetical protein
MIGKCATGIDTKRIGPNVHQGGPQCELLTGQRVYLSPVRHKSHARGREEDIRRSAPQN